MLPLNTITHGDYRDAMKDIPDGSIDAIITDPPYGILNHKIETGIDIKLFMQEANRVLKDGGFLAFFGQMPTLCDWMNEAKGDFKYRDHISWVKRVASGAALQIQRAHESVIIYSKGKSSSKYFTRKGRYSDVKVPGIQFDLITIEAFRTYIDYLHKEITTGKETTCDVVKKKSDSSIKTNDACHVVEGSYTYKRGREETNFTNVWSFLPQNKVKQDGMDESNIKHPTVKPTLLVNRLVELLTDKGMVILDPFIGSGTTAISCVSMGRDYIGIELDKEYYDLSVKRVKNHLPLLQMAM